MITLQSRYQGAMLGLLAGDALGAPLETKDRAYIRGVFKERGGLTAYDYIDPFEGKRSIKAGQPTDDSELAAALALSLVSVGDFDPPDVYRCLRDFIWGNVGKRRSYLTSGEAYGSGGTLRAALRAPTYADSIPLFREGLIPVVPSNGSLMRCAPVPLRYFRNMERVVEIARRQSAVTHVHSQAQAACMAYASFVANLLMYESAAVAWSDTCVMMRELVDEERKKKDRVFLGDFTLVANLPESMPTDAEIWPHTGSALLSLRIAVSAVLSSSNFRDGLTKAIEVGGDVDTYGAIAGGALGALYGIEGIPQEWLEVLQGKELMLSLADSLYEQASAK